jgi:transcriptional regulator with GAF, ATPase, and Fis domain
LETFAGRFALIRPLGEGGMGDVHLARDLESGETIALKRLSGRLRGVEPETLRNEFETLTRVRHPVIVAVHELAVAPDGTPYLSMEYVPGVPSDEAGLASDWPALVFVAAEVARGLEALHLARVVHGDVKPSNLLVLREHAGGPPAGVRLLDFGLAGLLDRDRPGHTGTPGFQAPEVVQGAGPSAASDLYGLGATLFMLATGQPPFPGDDPAALLHRQQDGPPPALPLEQAGAPPALVELILRLLAREPAERPASAAELRRELERIHPAARRPLAERLETAMLADRERELAAFEALVAGGPGARHVMFLAGESGCGKSMLIEAFAARATLAGRVVIRRTPSPDELPGETLRALTRRLESEAGDDGDAGSAPAAPADESERWIARAVRAIRRAAERRGEPLVLVDDADQLDEMSRTALRRVWLTRPAPASRWVLACGSAALDARSGERLLVDTGTASFCEPGPLSRAAVARLVATRLGSAPPAALVERLQERAGGHPGLTVALLREAARLGVVAVADGVLTVDEPRLDALEPPSDYAASELARLTALAPGPRDVVLALAVAGRPLEPAELAALAGPTAEETAIGLTAMGLVAHDDAGRWSCVAPWAARHLLETQPAGSARAWHERALKLPNLSWREKFEHRSGAGDTAAALEAAAEAFGALPDPRLAAAAATLAESHDPAEAAVWHERAAMECVRLGRYEAALPHWRRAWELEPVHSARAGTRALGWCVAALRSGHHRAAEEVALATETQVPPEFAARLMANRACAIDYEGRRSEAIGVAEAALAQAEACDDPTAESIACELLANQHLRIRRLEEAETWAGRAVVAYRRSGVPVAEMRSHLLLGAVAHAGNQIERAEEHYRAAIALARANGPRVSLEEHLTKLVGVLVDTGRWVEAGSCADEALRLAIEDGRGTGASLLMGMLAMLHSMVGRPRAAARAARRARQMQIRHAPRMLPVAWRATAAAARLQGHFGTATRASRRALRLAAGERLESAWARMELGVILMRRHRWAAADTMFARLIEDAGGVNGNATVIAQARRATVAAVLGEPETAVARLAVAERWVEAHPRSYARAAVAEARAALLLAQGRGREGIEAATFALESWAALPAPAERAGAALGFGRLALGHGLQHAPGLVWLRSAARTYERLGDQTGRAEALASEIEWLRRAQPAAPAEPVDQSDLLRRVGDLLRSLPDPRELTHRAMQLAVEQLRAERGVLLWMDRETRALSPVAEFGAVDAETREEAIGYSRQVTSKVAESGGVILVRDAGSDRRMLSDSVRNMKLRSILCVPMFHDGVVVGAVYLDDSRRSNTFGDDERRLLEGFAGLMAVAIDSSRGQEQTERQRSELERENRDLLAQAAHRIQHTGLLGTSPEMQKVFKAIEDAARSDNTSVLIGGESGTGKELVARTIHDLSRRRDKPFVVVNCGAITETLLESELFGHVRGAFTGAIRDRRGAFEVARGGTLFLDEIAEMPLAQQVALLSVLTNRQVTPVGGDRAVSVDARIVAATNADLHERIETGRFRDDLYYRLRVLDIELPPLRDRKADVPALAQHFLEQFCERDKRPVPRMLPQFVAVLMQSDWPGNVRELQNYVERVLARTVGHVLFPDPLPFDLQKGAAIPFLGPRRLPDAIAELERRMVREAVDRHEGNQSGAARELDISEQALRYKLRKYSLPSARENLRTRKKRRN